MRRPRRLEVDPRPGRYYVSVVDGKRVALLAGPFRYHRQARRFLRAARLAAERADPFATFYAFGTCRCPDGARAGQLNAALGFVPGRRRKQG